MIPPDNQAEIYVGLMSGTSLDGIDVAIVDHSEIRPTVLHCEHFPYTHALGNQLRLLNHGQTLSFDSLYRLDVELGELYSEAVLSALATAGITTNQIAAIGCHGQTLQHKPQGQFPYTLQIGDPNVIAARSGIDTVADFRRKDVALGGQGAPLAPLFHEHLFADSQQHRVVINIGGIANISCLTPSASSPSGFDTGPGNTLMDYWIEKNQHKPFDDAGEWAASGYLQTDLLASMLSGESYFSAMPPKTTGTEYFSPSWLKQHNIGEYDPRDVQTTLCELTAVTIATAIKNTMPQCDQCFVCGGGAGNQHLLARLNTLMENCPVETTEVLGIDPDFVEAIGFSWLARQRLHNQASNLPAITGSDRASVLGGLYSGR